MMMGKGMCGSHKISWILVLIGALNWGLVGIGEFAGANWNVVNLLLGAWPQVEWLVYILVGAAAIGMLFKDKCNLCMAAK